MITLNWFENEWMNIVWGPVDLSCVDAGVGMSNDVSRKRGSLYRFPCAHSIGCSVRYLCSRTSRRSHLWWSVLLTHLFLCELNTLEDDGSSFNHVHVCQWPAVTSYKWDSMLIRTGPMALAPTIEVLGCQRRKNPKGWIKTLDSTVSGVMWAFVNALHMVMVRAQMAVYRCGQGY